MRSVKFLVLISVLALVPAAASAADYVLVAPNWGAQQTAAVQMAGGIVLSSHGRAGIGIVTSEAPDFLDRALASNAFRYGAEDQMVEWQPPLLVETAVNASDDPFFPLQWNLQSMEAPAAWAAGCTGAGARVAILDGGIYSAHTDLDDNLDIACSRSFVPGQPFNNDTGTFWHGTHVAGIVAAEDNTRGTVGVAPDATLIGVKVLHSGTGSFGRVINGILYAADPAAFGSSCTRADIINMSLGAVFAKNGAGSLIGALNQAVNFAASQGVLVVSAAGNNGLDFGQLFNVTSVPADSGSGLAVSATGPLGFALGATNFTRPASYSNYGEGLIQVAAPGGDFALPGTAVCTVAPVTSQCWVFDLVLSTSRGGSSLPPTGGYSFSAGTSMAAPAASGVAALIVGKNPGISLGALKTKLAQSAVDEGKVGHDEFYGHGFVNARRACSQ